MERFRYHIIFRQTSCRQFRTTISAFRRCCRESRQTVQEQEYSTERQGCIPATDAAVHRPDLGRHLQELPHRSRHPGQLLRAGHSCQHRQGGDSLLQRAEHHAAEFHHRDAFEAHRQGRCSLHLREDGHTYPFVHDRRIPGHLGYAVGQLQTPAQQLSCARLSEPYRRRRKAEHLPLARRRLEPPELRDQRF